MIEQILEVLVLGILALAFVLTTLTSVCLWSVSLTTPWWYLNFWWDEEENTWGCDRCGENYCIYFYQLTLFITRRRHGD